MRHRKLVSLLHEVLHCATLSLQHQNDIGKKYITVSLQCQYVIGLHHGENPIKIRCHHNIACPLGRGSKIFLVGILSVQNFFRRYFVGPNIFLVGISLVQFFISRGLIRDSRIFSFWLDLKIRKYISNRVLFPIDFNNYQLCLYYKGTSSTKLIILLCSFHLC